MIKRKTVFVLGAGAHIPYGFPDGRGLIAKIIGFLPSTGGRGTGTGGFTEVFWDLYSSSLGQLGSLYVQFRRELAQSGHASIDSFLATHASRMGYPELGKLAVAYALLPLEFKYTFARGAKDDWMSYLFEYMFHGCRDSIDDFVANNNVSFVTFNYDRTLEHFFAIRLAATYGVDMAKAWEAAKRIPIVHVYGSLGGVLPSLTHRAVRSEPVNPFEFGNPPGTGPYTPIEIKHAAESIRLMYEDRSDHSGVMEAQLLLRGAECVCFLGFGFDPDNIERMDLGSCCMPTQPGKFVVATRYKVGDGEWTRTQVRMPGIFNYRVDRDWDSLTLLKEMNVLL